MKRNQKNRTAWLTFEKKIVLSFIILVLVITSIIFLSRNITAESRETRKWVVRSEQVLALNASVISNIKDIVIGTRGYLITKDPTFLKTYALAHQSITDSLARLKGDAYIQHQRSIDSIQKLFEQYLGIRLKAIDLASSSNSLPMEEINLVRASDKLFSELRTMASKIESEERALLRKRRIEYQESIQDSAIAIRILLLFFVLTIIIGFIIVLLNSIKRKKAEKALIKSQELITAIIEHAPVLVNIKNREGKYILANRQFAHALQSTPEEVLGKTNFDLMPREAAEKISKEDEHVLQTLQASELEVKLQGIGGEHSYIISKFPLLDEKGRLYAIGSTTSDITPIKKAHIELEKSYHKLQQLLNGLQEAMSTSSDMICVINETGEFVMVSDTSLKLLGYTAKELLHKKFMDFVADEDKLTTESIARTIMQGISVSDFINCYVKKDGNKIPLIWSAKWIEADRMMYCIARNGSEKQRTAEELAQSQSRLINAQRTAHLGNWELDLKTNELSCSDEMYRLIGAEKENAGDIVQLLQSAIHPEDRAALDQAKKEALASGKKIDIEHRIVHPDGTVCQMHTIGEVIFDDDKKPVWISGTMQDITKKKNAELELQKLNAILEKNAAELKASNTELERFAYVASHDLQEPLRMVSSFLSLLQKKLNGELDETSRKYIHFAVDGADRMKKLIQDLLHYSRLGTSDEKFSPVNLEEVLAEVKQVYGGSLDESGGRLLVNHLPVVYGDKTQLSQLFQNLVGNALKYKSRENPIVEISCQELEKEWLFSVKDNGIGIEEKYFDKIFIIFQRLHHKTEFKGTGIGLAICKKIVERHSGHIWVSSSPGQGSNFQFTVKKHPHV